MMKINEIVSVKDVKTGKVRQITFADIDALYASIDRDTHQRAFAICHFQNHKHNDKHIWTTIAISTDTYEQLYDYVQEHNLIKDEFSNTDIDVDRMVILKSYKDLHPVKNILWELGLIRKDN